MCHPVIRKRRADAVPAETRVNQPLLEMTGRGDKTNCADGGAWLTGYAGPTGLTGTRERRKNKSPRSPR